MFRSRQVIGPEQSGQTIACRAIVRLITATKISALIAQTASPTTPNAKTILGEE
ncbi:MAG: hypothetical protein ACRD4A_14690 [Candidatus Acidiferrales bacterium]